MTFWLRHIFLIVACVVLPFGAALYLDTQAEIARTQASGEKAASVAVAGLEAHLRLQRFQDVEQTRGIAARLSSGLDLRTALRPSSPELTAATKRLDAFVPAGGFAWVVDDRGRVVSGEGAPKSLSGHPVFLQTQAGFGLDTFWQTEGEVLVMTAVPMTLDGAAYGAVLRARPLDADAMSSVARNLHAEITLARGPNIVATTLSDELAAELKQAGGLAAGERAVSFGRISEPITASNAPFLPIFVDHRAAGLGYTALSFPVSGSDLAWSVAVRSGDELSQLGERQAIVVAAMLASIMLAILIGLINSRTFVRPLAMIESHLSSIQQGFGQPELPEATVSRPYRRLVRLINMTVQKLPSSVGLGTQTMNLGPMSTASLESPSQNLGTAPTQNLPTVSERPTPVEPPPNVSHDLLLPPTRPTSGGVASDLFSEDDAPAGPISTPSPVEAPAPRSPTITQEEEPSPMFAGSLEGPLSNAIDSMQAPTPIEEPPAPRRANEIRGGTPRFGDDRPTAATGADLSSSAGLPQPSAFATEATAVAPVAEDLLSRSAQAGVSRDRTAVEDMGPQFGGAAKNVATDSGVDENGLDSDDRAHFKEIYERFIEMRRQCGEPTADLAFDRFYQKLIKNRDALVSKYSCRTVRFQVYEKAGKAALKATPVRAR